MVRGGWPGPIGVYFFIFPVGVAVGVIPSCRGGCSVDPGPGGGCLLALIFPVLGVVGVVWFVGVFVPSGSLGRARPPVAVGRDVSLDVAVVAPSVGGLAFVADFFNLETVGAFAVLEVETRGGVLADPEEFFLVDDGATEGNLESFNDVGGHGDGSWLGKNLMVKFFEPTPLFIEKEEGFN